MDSVVDTMAHRSFESSWEPTHSRHNNTDHNPSRQKVGQMVQYNYKLLGRYLHIYTGQSSIAFLVGNDSSPCIHTCVYHCSGCEYVGSNRWQGSPTGKLAAVMSTYTVIENLSQEEGHTNTLIACMQ